MNETYAQNAYPQGAPQQQDAREATGAARRDDYVLRFDRSTPFIAAAAFAIGVLVGFALD